MQTLSFVWTLKRSNKCKEMNHVHQPNEENICYMVLEAKILESIDGMTPHYRYYSRTGCLTLFYNAYLRLIEDDLNNAQKLSD